MPGTGQMLMGPSALAKAIAIPYSSERLWQTGEYCTHEGRVYQFTGETLLAGEAWDPTHWQEKIVIDELVKKADKVTSATSGNFASLDANGNLADSGHKHDDYLTSHQDISGKQDKTDNTLDTTAKTVVGAINEHEGDISGANQAIAGIATVITGTTNNSGHSISSGEYFIANGAKYKASATIGTGVTWADKATSVSDHDLINALNSNLANLESYTSNSPQVYDFVQGNVARTITFGGTFTIKTRQNIGFIVVEGQSRTTSLIPIGFGGSGATTQPSDLIIGSNNDGITVSGMSLNIPENLHGGWGSITIIIFRKINGLTITME